MGRTVQYLCPNCERLIYVYDEDDHFYEEGSPIGSCPNCGAAYLDKRFREIALEEDIPQQEKKKESQMGAAVQSTKRNRWRSKKKEPDVIPVELDQLELSEERLSNYEYLLKLYSLEYLKYYPLAAKELHIRIMKHLQPYLQLLEEKIGSPNKTYRLKNAESLFSQLVYDAKDPKAVETVIRDVLCHYGVDPLKFQVQVEYQEKEMDKDGGTLGTFTPNKPFGGTIRVVLVPRYSEYDMVIAVILHECAHALLYSRMVSLPETKENERLTDVAAIYMGGGEYIRRGYYMYKSFRVGYLQHAESEVIINEVEQKIKRVTGSRDELLKRIDYKLLNPPDISECVHPTRVIRGKMIIAETQRAILSWKDRSDDISKSVRKIKSLPTDWEPMKTIERLEQFEKEIDAYDQLIRGWKETEEYQTGLSGARMEYIKGIMPMADAKNVYAMLQMVCFWCECPATRRDAEVYYHQFMKNDQDADSLYAAGFCSLYGMAVEKNEQEGRALLCKAAALGSQDAANALNGII